MQFYFDHFTNKIYFFDEVSLNELIISSNKSSNFIELKKISSSICFFEICFKISLHLFV
jgi:hypothetical protein